MKSVTSSGKTKAAVMGAELTSTRTVAVDTSPRLCAPCL